MLLLVVNWYILLLYSNIKKYNTDEKELYTIF